MHFPEIDVTTKFLFQSERDLCDIGIACLAMIAISNAVSQTVFARGKII